MLRSLSEKDFSFRRREDGTFLPPPAFQRPMEGVYKAWLAAMRRGDFASAWDISRAALPAAGPPDDPTLPYHLRTVWRGEPFEGRDVLVRCYHGLGDTIQFARYLPLLRERARSVTVEMEPHLIPLFEDFPGIDRLIPFDHAAPAPPAECNLEIMELMFALQRTPGECPMPYLAVEPEPLLPGTLGLCWQGGAGWDPERSIAPELFQPLARHRAVSLVAEPTNLPVLNPEGCPLDIIATAELIAGVELVITVDTMIAHLAGAMGRPTWLLLKRECDWRWACDPKLSPWYPSVRIYRQMRPGDWEGVIDRVAADLDRREAASCLRAQRPLSIRELAA